jgi:hypothetical protein
VALNVVIAKRNHRYNRIGTHQNSWHYVIMLENRAWHQTISSARRKEIAAENNERKSGREVGNEIAIL